MSETPQPAPEGKPKRGPLGYLGELLFGPKVKPKALDALMLAVDRTELAYERTMMAWIRTGVSLISFGFTIYKFFQIEGYRPRAEAGLIGSRGFAALMIVTGLVAVLLAALQHHRAMQILKASGVEVAPSLATLVGALVAILGILGLLAVLLNQ